MKTWKTILMILAILIGWIGSITVICNVIENKYRRICDRKGWYWRDKNGTRHYE